jgi:hypothetical protein
MQHRKTLGNGACQPVDSPLGAGETLRRRRLGPARRHLMELRTRLNVLAAIISFAFLTAVVLGMI